MSQFFIDTNQSGLSTVDTLTGNTGGEVGPDSSNNINVLGSGAISVSGNAGTHTLTIITTSGGVSWSDKSTSFPALAGNGYRATAALTAALPASPSDGDTIIINTRTASAVVILANTGQTINLGDQTSSSNGTLTSATIGSSVTLVYQSSATTWNTISNLGSWAVA